MSIDYDRDAALGALHLLRRSHSHWADGLKVTLGTKVTEESSAI